MRTTGAGTAGMYAQRAAHLLAGASAALLAICAGYYVALGPSGLGAAWLTPARPLYLVGLVAGVLCLLAVFKLPEAGLLLLVALLYTNASEVAVRYYDIPSPLQLLMLATAAGMAARLLPHGEGGGRRLILDPVLLPLALYGAVIFASSVGASDVGLADERLSEHLKSILVFLVVTNLVTSRLMLRRVVWALVLSGAFLGTISVYQVLTNSYGQEFGGFGRVKIAQIVGQTREPRIAGPLSDPNFYAQVLVALVPLALYRLWDEPSLSRKLVAGYALAVTTLAAVFTYSRGGALSLGLVLLLAFAHKRVGPKYFLLGLLALAPLALFVPESFEGRLGTLRQLAPTQNEEVTGGVDSSFRQRRLMMTAAWEMFSDHPLLGVGAGNYSEHFDDYAGRLGTSLRSYDNFGQQRYPHSLYLEVVAETGLAGLIALAFVIVAALMSLWTAYRSLSEAGATRSANMVASLALALTAYLATSLILHGHYIRYLWLLVAVSVAAGHVARRAAAGEDDV